jgi:hypothetical protein
VIVFDVLEFNDFQQFWQQKSLQSERITHPAAF